MADPREPDARTVSSNELRRDGRSVLMRAEREGPITVLDDAGSARMVIYVPNDSLPYNDD